MTWVPSKIRRCSVVLCFISDLTTDSWRSKTVAVLIFVSVYVQFATIILAYFGVSVTELTVLRTPNDCLVYFNVSSLNEAPAEAPVAVGAPGSVAAPMPPTSTAPIDPPVVAPPDSGAPVLLPTTLTPAEPPALNGTSGNDTAPSEPPVEPPHGSVTDGLSIKWGLAIGVMLIVLVFLAGMSSRQHISITIISCVAILAFNLWDIAVMFSGPVSIPQMVAVLQMPNGWYCTAAALPYLMQRFIMFVLKVLITLFFFYYFIARYAFGGGQSDYDDWRLRQAYKLTRRLATPIPYKDLPKEPKPWLGFLFKCGCCRACSSGTRFDAWNEESNAIEMQSVNSPPGSPDSSRDLIDGRFVSRQSTIRQMPARIREALRETAYWFVHDLKHMLTPATPSVHSLFEKKNDILYSSRFILVLGTSIAFMAIAVCVTLGILLQFQDRMRNTLQAALIDAYGLPPYLIDILDLILQDFRNASIVGCTASFGIVLFVSWLTTNTYRESIIKLRQGQQPFLVHVNSYYASFYMGYQISHFVLGLFVALYVTFIAWAVFRVIISVEVVRTVGWKALSTLLIPWSINFSVQLVLVFVFAAWGGRNLRFRFLFQFIDISNLTISMMTTIIPSMIRLLGTTAMQLLLFARIDIPFQLIPSIDSAHGAFAALVYQDHFNNNPIKLVFVDIMQNLVRNLQTKSASSTPEDMRKAEHHRRMERRWRLVILLAKYPGLKDLRKHALRAKKAAHEGHGIPEVKIEQESLKLKERSD